MSMIDYQMLLSTASELTKEDGMRRDYNIFRVLEVESREVPMCRVLADLLNPNGLHGKGCTYLNTFLSEVLNRDDADEICKTARVYKEYPIDAERRIDLVIAADSVFIPIEVKIYASEQQAQCYDYIQFARKKDPHAKVVYLTIHGDEPSDYSLSSKDGDTRIALDDCLCVSFVEDITGWLTLLLECETDPVMSTMLQQYREAIKQFTGGLDEGVQMKLVEKIMESEDNFLGMLAISNVVDRTKAALLFTLLSEIDCALEEIAPRYGLERETYFRWYEYQDKADQNYYKQRESTYPGLNYVFRDILLPGNVQLWLRVEVDYALFFGLCLFDAEANDGNGEQMDYPTDEIKETLKDYIHNSAFDYDGWWVHWWYLPTGTNQKNVERELVPDFKSMNEAAIALSDKGKRKALVDKVISIIEDKLSQSIKRGNTRQDG